ncbi:PAS domain S-box-containing protein [Nannocystis exedens]|uniref:histidine kinase n=2 Tax=Nannocystis exedens TaxID=54 RepID=A0A1I2HKQ1_9BACT|nr:hybrid sensor histidine kinase/response regulator [Nannocystis exedens]SFF30319.1 PAS domain S-box-containing protein [Nannocystis exedens]
MTRDDDELARERERLQITLASIGDAVISTDVDGRVTYLNPVAETLTGWSTSEAVGRPLTEVFHIVHERTRQTVENPALRALRDGVVVGLANHTCLIARDGSERPIDDSAAPIRDGEGRAVGAVLVFRDVSERRRAEEAQARLAAIVASSEDAIVSKTLDTIIRTWNAGAERLFGYTAAEAVGRSITMIIPPERLDEERQIIARLVRGERVEWFETVRVAKDGRRLDISLTVSPLHDSEGQVVGASKIARDITAQKQAQAALRASEGRHRFLAELAAATQAQTEPEEVLAVTARLLAEHLDVDRCAYAEVEDEATFVITGDHSRGVPSIVGRWPVGSFGPALTAAMEAHEPFVVEDVDADPRLDEAQRPAYRATQIQAVVCVPLHKHGKFIAAMAAHSKTPRRWRPDEVTLVRTVADRCWEALERTRADRRLRDSEARYRAIVEATPECVKLVAPDGTVLQMNSAGLGIIEADEDAVLGQSVFGIVAPEDRAAFRAFHERVCRGERGNLAFDVVGLRGTRRHMESTAVPLPAPGGGWNHLAVSRDVTERAVAERALADSRARLDFAVRLSGVGFWYCDLPFDELQWDARVKEHFWLPPSARVTIDTFYERMHPEDRERTRTMIDASIRELAPYDTVYRTVDPESGAIKWIRAVGGAVCAADGTPIRFDGVTVDITEDKRDEQRLSQALEREREQAHMLRQVADASLAIHSAQSLESVLAIVAEEARRIIGAGHACSSLTGADDSTGPLAVTTTGDGVRREYGAPAGVEVLVDLVCRSQRPLRLAGEGRANRSDGRGAPRRWLAAPFVDRQGENLGLVQLWDEADGGFGDSDEVMLVQLAHITSVAIENARLNAALREQDRRKDEFLALLAHELRNPLAPIRNGLEALRLSDDPAIQEHAQAVMDRQLGHMVRLIDDLLDISRISRNKMELRRARVVLADVVNNAIETARPFIDAARHTLEVSLPPRPVVLDADLTRLAQVFSNLLTNSAKYTPPGGHIRLTAERSNGEVSVVVRDDGIGIPRAALTSIFDMFSQIDRSIERSNGGLGIGLALVKGLVEMHGGTVTCDSAGPGMGSAFTVTLPVIEPQPPTASSGGPNGERDSSGGRRVLVVDDNEDSALTMAMMLRLLGHRVEMAHDGVAAVAAAESFRPELILMDMGMPRLNGYDATRQIRQQPWGAAMRIVALTGWGQESDRARSKEAGCDQHLVKPVPLAELKKLMASM